jgi:hypothetical protein
VFEIELRINRPEVTKITFVADMDWEHLELQNVYPVDDSAWQSVPAMRGDAFERMKPGQEQDEAVLRIRIRLKSVDAGTKIWFHLRDVVLWVDDTAYPVEDICWERTVAQIVSDDSYLSELRLSDCVLSPEFSPYQQEYTATVSHHVAQVTVMATARDGGASVKVDSPALEYGKTSNVTVTVTAEDGSVRVYTIAVTREDAPQRVPSNNCNLQLLEIKDYKLSPEFSPGITDYVLWLPYETTKVEVIATPEDSRATVTIVGNKGFEAGQDNLVLVTCTAEDGTQKVYTVIAKRAASHDATEPTEPGTQPTTPPTQPTEPTTTPGESQDAETQESNGGIQIWLVLIIGVACLAVGAAAGVTIGKKSSAK